MASGSVKQVGGRSKGMKNWTDAETMALIHIWGEEDMQAHFASVGFTDVQVFRKIAERLRKVYGVDRTGQACQHKIRKLKENYKKVKDNKNRSGRGFKTCKHFEELDKILGNRPLQMPRNLLDTSTQATDENSQDDIIEDYDENIDEEEELDDTVEPLGSPSERLRSASFSSTSSAESFTSLGRGGTGARKRRSTGETLSELLESLVDEMRKGRASALEFEEKRLKAKQEMQMKIFEREDRQRAMDREREERERQERREEKERERQHQLEMMRLLIQIKN